MLDMEDTSAGKKPDRSVKETSLDKKDVQEVSLTHDALLVAIMQ